MKFCIKVVWFKQMIFSKYAKKSENDYIPQKPENLRFAPIMIF